MTHLIAVYRQQLKTAIAEQLQYRAALVIWLIEVALGPAVSISVWSTVARNEGGEVNGYSPSGFAAYFIATMLVNYATQTWVFWEFSRRVREGEFSPLLLRPVHPIHADIAQHLAYKILMLPVIGLVTLILWLAFHAGFTPSTANLATFLPALLLAFALRFTLEWTLALLAFWLTQVNVINQLYVVVVLFLSGQLLPLSFLPAPLQAVTAWLPFQWMVAFPAQLLSTGLSAQAVVTGFLAQLIWLLLGLGLLSLTWRRGLKRYTAVGG
ncbi:MAG: ABC-2 family transporter protein [Thermogemmatispora sp.]|uniref:ABC transporter permease n=1 Tax=Thermogemmatispora sp. TaxID=1968838 RepID=UPI00260B6612|nr:ABC-2 family transporter protein [Thermogemmatispora sp.]MBX5457187.1 ABC-2 family transporter protein [Thermogemmatispora sp.]